MNLNIVECRNCGKAFWFDGDYAGPIAGGPCCKGLPIMDIEQHPTERAAIKGYPAWRKARSAALKSKLDEIKKSEVKL